MKVLLTGGCGYIGSHVAVELLQNDHEIVIVDNHPHIFQSKIDKIKKITKRNFIAHQIDITNEGALTSVLKDHHIDIVFHFAALKSPGESLKSPLRYFKNNVGGTLSLLSVMKDLKIHDLVFSSSAAIYGDPQYLPIDEKHPANPLNPYGRSKLICEDLLRDFAQGNSEFKVSVLRYFNPVGAHPSALLGEDFREGQHLMAVILQVLAGDRTHVDVLGSDYQTSDGTGVRDYIHISDLVSGHLQALEVMKGSSGFSCFNLGTGCGYTVLQVISAFEKVSGLKIPYKIKERREGDSAVSYTDPAYAYEKLHWKAEKSLLQMCEDSFKFFKKNYPIRLIK